MLKEGRSATLGLGDVATATLCISTTAITTTSASKSAKNERFRKTKMNHWR